MSPSFPSIRCVEAVTVCLVSIIVGDIDNERVDARAARHLGETADLDDVVAIAGIDAVEAATTDKMIIAGVASQEIVAGGRRRYGR